MLNEGIVTNDTSTLVKSEMIRQIRHLGPTTADDLERAVFRAMTGHDRQEVDWEVEDNQAGYYTWVKSFDKFIKELIEDGYIREEVHRRLVPTQSEAPIEYSQLVYPPAR